MENWSYITKLNLRERFTYFEKNLVRKTCTEIKSCTKHFTSSVKVIRENLNLSHTKKKLSLTLTFVNAWIISLSRFSILLKFIQNTILSFTIYIELAQSKLLCLSSFFLLRCFISFWTLNGYLENSLKSLGPCGSSLLFTTGEIKQVYISCSSYIQESRST